MADRDQTERIGVNAVEAIFLGMGWIFREQPISDYGIDAQAEPKDDEKPTGRLIALQIKTGESYFRKRGNNFVFYGDDRHLSYWTNHSLPVFLILHNPADGLTVWQRITRDKVVETDRGGWSVEIPPSNILDASAAPYLRSGIARDPRSVRQFNLALDLPLMKAISAAGEGDAVYLVVQEWVNKSLNFRQSEIKIGDLDADAEYVLDTWMPARDINHFMSRFFPWLHYEYADEIEEYYGEVEEHRLEIRINDLGAAYLAVESYCETGATPEDIEPPEREGDDAVDWDERFADEPDEEE